jgi:hypothetical protein
VHFPTSCTPAPQEKFDRGVALVHSFFYPDSVKAFTDASEADPQCAIAYWGIAISQRPNPLVLPLPATALKNGFEAVQKGRSILAKTERERDWLAAIEVYYKDYDKVDQTTRGLAYEKAMEQLMQKYPADVEAAIFYALALNETALPSDRTYAKQLKAGAILEKIAQTLPEHPGVLHYLITATTTRPSPSAESTRPTHTQKSPPRRLTLGICRRISTRWWDIGRNRSRRTQARWWPRASRLPGPGPAPPIRLSPTC